MAKPLLLKGATVVDAEGERSADVLVEGGRIARVGDVPSGDAEVLSAQGKFLTPGLIDCHVHLTLDAGADVLSATRRSEAELGALALAHAVRTLQGGVTTVREVGTAKFADAAVKRILQQGVVRGPRLLSSGWALTTTGGHGHFLGREADTAEDLVKAAREQVKQGAEWIKVIATGGVLTEGANLHASQYTLAQLTALVEDARRMGRGVAAHAHGEEGIERAVQAGVASIEHGTYLSDALAELMRAKGTFLVPTAAAGAGIVEAGTARGIPEDAVRKATEAMKRHKDAVQRAVAKGVAVALGTDAGTPFNAHGDNAREVELLVAYGMKPEQALAAATTTAARLLRLQDRVGRVRAGFEADLLLLHKNPLDDPAAYRKGLARVMRAGAWVT